MRLIAGRQNIQAIKSLKDAPKATRRGIRRGFYFFGKDLATDAKGYILKGPKTGKLYKVRGRKKRHRASGPGESPANLTGALRKSVDYQVQGSDEMEFGAGTDYAAFTELGTKNMEERPYLIRAIKNNERNAEKHFEREIRKELEGRRRY